MAIMVTIAIADDIGDDEAELNGLVDALEEAVQPKVMDYEILVHDAEFDIDSDESLGEAMSDLSEA